MQSFKLNVQFQSMQCIFTSVFMLICPTYRKHLKKLIIFKVIIGKSFQIINRYYLIMFYILAKLEFQLFFF